MALPQGGSREDEQEHVQRQALHAGRMKEKDLKLENENEKSVCVIITIVSKRPPSERRGSQL